MHTLQGIPAAANHTFNFVANTSHQDYKVSLSLSLLPSCGMSGS